MSIVASHAHSPFVYSDSNQSRNDFHPTHSFSLASLSAVRGLPKVDNFEFLIMLILRSLQELRECLNWFFLIIYRLYTLCPVS
jgi:hypothetical protein